MKTLLVFEGAKREPLLYGTLNQLYFKGRDQLICIYGTSIGDLYARMKEYDFELDIVAVLKEKLKNDVNCPFSSSDKMSDFPEVFLFFDYDCQQVNFMDAELKAEFDKHLETLLDFFNDETGHGKLYINYPMIEAIRYTKKLPDKDFKSYVLALDECANFKRLAASFSHYGNMDFLMAHKVLRKEELDRLKENWTAVIKQHVDKAAVMIQRQKTDSAEAGQGQKFAVERDDYMLGNGVVAILAAFPLFLRDYFGPGILKFHPYRPLPEP